MNSQQLQLGDLASLRDSSQETNQQVKEAVDRASRLEPIVIESADEDIVNPLDYFLDNPQYSNVHDLVKLCIQLNIPITEQLLYIRYFADDEEKFTLFLDRLSKIAQYFQQISLWTNDYHVLSKQFVALLTERSRNAKQVLKLYAAITTLQMQIFSFANEANTVLQKKIRSANVLRQPLFNAERLAEFCYLIGLSSFQISELEELSDQDFYNYEFNTEDSSSEMLTPRLLNNAFEEKLQALGLRLDRSEITQEMVEQSQQFYRDEETLFKKYTAITSRLPVGYFLTQVVLEDTDRLYVFDSNRMYARLSTDNSEEIGIGLENTNLLPFDQRLKVIEEKEEKSRNERRHVDLHLETDKDLKELQEIREQKRLQQSLKTKVNELKQQAIKIKNKALLDVELMKERQKLENTEIKDTIELKQIEQSNIAEQERIDKPQVELVQEKEHEVVLSSIETDGEMLDFQRSLDTVNMALSHLENPQQEQEFVPGFTDQQQATRHNSINSLENNSLTPNLPSNFVYDPKTQKYKEETQLKLEQQLQEYKNKIYNGLENLQQQVLAGNVLAAGMSHDDRMHFLTESQRNLRSPFSEQHENSDVAKKIADQIIADQNAKERARLKAIRMRSQQKQRNALSEQKGRDTKSEQPKSPVKLVSPKGASPVEKSKSPQEIEMVRIPRRPSEESGYFSPKIAKISDADLVRDQEVLERVPSANMSSLRLKEEGSATESMLHDDSKPDVDIGQNENIDDGAYSRNQNEKSAKAKSPLSIEEQYEDEVQEEEEEELMETEEEMEEQEEEMEEEEETDENE